MDLFDYNEQQNFSETQPLASRMRPQTLDELVGQEHIVGEGKLLRRAIESDRLFSSIILFGPPGTGKTTLAQLIAKASSADFVTISAVLAGVQELRQVVGGLHVNVADCQDAVLVNKRLEGRVHNDDLSERARHLPQAFVLIRAVLASGHLIHDLDVILAAAHPRDEINLSLLVCLLALVIALPALQHPHINGIAPDSQLVIDDVLYAKPDVVLPEVDTRVAQPHVLGIVLCG